MAESIPPILFSYLCGASQEVRQRFVLMLRYNKFKRLFSRLFKLVSKSERLALIDLVCECFDSFDFLEGASQTNCFINSVVSAFVACVADMTDIQVLNLIEKLAKKTSLLWILLNTAGIVLFCVFLSRVEMIKNERPLALPVQAKWYTAIIEGMRAFGEFLTL